MYFLFYFNLFICYSELFITEYFVTTVHLESIASLHLHSFKTIEMPLIPMTIEYILQVRSYICGTGKWKVESNHWVDICYVFTHNYSHTDFEVFYRNHLQMTWRGTSSPIQLHSGLIWRHFRHIWWLIWNIRIVDNHLFLSLLRRPPR